MDATEAMTALRVTPRDSSGRLESRSGAGVHPVTTAGGAPAFLKVGADERELRFYREMRVPVRTPELLDFLVRGQEVALLLSASGATVDIAQWTDVMWAGLFADLAALHATPPPRWDAPDPLLEAMARPDLGLIRGFWGDDVRPDPDHLRSAMSGAGRAFVHGDCHTENITVTGGYLHFCDWQSAGAGRPSADLALLSVRATPAGVRVPLERFPAGEPLRQAVEAEELAILIFLWPLYAGYNSDEGNERVRRRGRSLARSLRG
ncbi:phosphotransferase [Paractinoplanes brasiliensis]|uniref:phosphotransferase n=1 Tax=Paractinoplanes brasiliensis TaxID=52695 RepID=UPI00106215B6|nr:phosphotransferase [Actinoplanes brasiliensis]